MKRVALVYDWLESCGGGEHCLVQMLALFPDADVFALVDFANDDLRRAMGGRRAKTSFIQRLPFAARGFRRYVGLMPLAIEQFDLSEYDLVISISTAFAKGVPVGPDQLHICYCSSPMRYVWDLYHQYLSIGGLARGIKSIFARALIHYLRFWDFRTSASVQHFIANSDFIRRRINRVYHRHADVIYPPVNIGDFTLCGEKDGYYITTSRLVGSKRIDLIIEAFRARPDDRLIVVGDGPDSARLRKLAGPNVSFTGYVTQEKLVSLLQKARAFVFAAEEDFGIAPVEAMACGTPVIAYGKGGVLESVIGDGAAQTGVFFARQNAQSINDAITAFEGMEISPENCRRQAEKFSEEQFRTKIGEYIRARWRDEFGADFDPQP